MTFFVDGIHICPSWNKDCCQLTWHLSQWHLQFWRWSIRQVYILWKWNQEICIKMTSHCYHKGINFSLSSRWVKGNISCYITTSATPGHPLNVDELSSAFCSNIFKQMIQNNLYWFWLHFFTIAHFCCWCSLVNGNVARYLFKMSFNKKNKPQRHGSQQTRRLTSGCLSKIELAAR